MDARGFAKIRQRNKFCAGDTIELMKPDGRNVPVTVRRLYDADGTEVDAAPHPKQELYLELTQEAAVYDLLRVKK